MGVKLGGIACCCGGPCCSVTDAFNRADSTTVGGNWVETTGDWSIASNKLSISSTGTITETTCATEDGDAGTQAADFDMQVTVSAGADNVVVKLGMHDVLAVLDFLANTVDIEPISTCSTVGFTFNASTNYTVRIIYKAPVVCVRINGTCVLVGTIKEATPVQAQATLRVTTNPTPTAVTFDDFTLTVHTTTENCITSCDAAGCGAMVCANCSTGTTPRQMKAVVAGVADAGGCAGGINCAIYNGTFYLDQCFCRPLTHVDECATAGSDPVDACMWALGFAAQQQECTFPVIGYNWIRMYQRTTMNVIFMSPGTNNLDFAHATFASGDSCAFNGTSFPTITSGTGCSTASATCTVTAITEPA